MWKFLTKITQERLVPNEETLDILRSLSRTQRESLYQYLTYLSYIVNKDHDRMASLRIRNRLDKVTFSNANKSEGEKDPSKATKPSDSIPDAMKDE